MPPKTVIVLTQFVVAWLLAAGMFDQKHSLVYPVYQSRHMQKQLERANKQVKLLKLKGEDHHLSSPETRHA